MPDSISMESSEHNRGGLSRPRAAAPATEARPTFYEVDRDQPPLGHRLVQRALFDHQERGVEALRDWLSGPEKTGILCLPTGGGKTRTAVSFVLGDLVSHGARCLWLTHRIELIDQATATFVESAYDCERSFTVGEWSSYRHEARRADVLVASIPTLNWGRRKNLQRLTEAQGAFDLIVVDECHHGAAPSWKALLDHLLEQWPNARILGLSATPTRTAEEEQPLLARIFGRVLHEVGQLELIRSEVLAKPVLVPIDTHITYEMTTSERRAFVDETGELPQTLLTRIAEDEERNKLIVDALVTNGPAWGQTLVFAETIAQGGALTALLRESGVTVEEVYGHTASEARRAIVETVRSKDVRVVINCGVFTEGTDLPCVETVALARATRSRILFAQMVGRGMRGPKTGGSEECRVVSFYDSVTSALHESLTSSFTDENEMNLALGIIDDPAAKVAVSKPEDDEAAAKLTAAIENLRALFERHGLSEETARSMPLRGWWTARAQISGRERRATLPCFGTAPNARELRDWVVSTHDGRDASLAAPLVPPHVLEGFARIAKVSGAIVEYVSATQLGAVPEAIEWIDITDAMMRDDALAPLQLGPEAPAAWYLPPGTIPVVAAEAPATPETDPPSGAPLPPLPPLPPLVRDVLRLVAGRLRDEWREIARQAAVAGAATSERAMLHALVDLAIARRAARLP